ncbi:MAG: hypothetical protein V4673_14675 [Pseudomonadota bacterium]
MSPRVIQLPVSGGDRKHYVRELRQARESHKRVLDRTIDAYNVAHRLYCEEWTLRQFIGGEVDPSPMIGSAVLAGCTLLRVECRTCGHGREIDLKEIIWPREKQVHTLTKALRCANCNAHRPNLIGLYDPSPDSPGRAARRR